MLKYIIIICLFLNGCTTYKHNQLEKKIIKKQQSWLNIQYLAMKKPQLTNKKGTMQTHKKYQYLYLKEKIQSKYNKNQYYCEMYDCFDTIDEIDKREDFYNNWLNKINKKYNYIN